MTDKPLKTEDNFFIPAGNNKPYIKMALEGFAGPGKSFTPAVLAIGLHKRIGSTKPVILFDTEKASKFLKNMFDDAGIELLVRESNTLTDLKETMRRLREEEISDILIIDSITHIYEDFIESYKKKVNRTALQFQDWGVIKPVWQKEFSRPLVNDPYHILFCGRAGDAYTNEINPDTGRREILKSGIKMQGEKNTAYEPDILILMERYEDILTDKKVIYREATVLKGRSQIIDGKTFKNPTYGDFSAEVEYTLKNPIKTESTPITDNTGLFHTE